jgi:phage shock protein PspC (stress-responsive transcriptional regulator)
MKKKLTSRKLWLAIAGLVVGILAMFGVDANTTQQISGVIMALGSVIAYIVGEGLVDAASASTSSNENDADTK